MARLRQRIAAALLAYATFITMKCPCAKVNGCHMGHYFLSVGGATVIVLNDKYGWVQVPF